MTLSTPATAHPSHASAAQATALYEVLYVSTMAADAPLRMVADIANQARTANLEAGITGILVFDGMRFCQHLEGPRKPVLALLERIRQDARHTQVEVVYHRECSERRFRRFSMGYTTLDEVDMLEKIENLDGQAAMDAFIELVATLDLDA